MMLPPLWVLTQLLSDGRYYFSNSNQTLVAFRTKRSGVRLADEWNEGWDVEKFLPILEVPSDVLEELDRPPCIFAVMKHNGKLHTWQDGRSLKVYSRPFEAFRESMTVEGGCVVAYVLPKGP